jgi:N-dimethylarginine dimethylaminohydrolase
MPEFEKKAQALQTAKLPRWMADKEETFKLACNDLEDAVQKLSSLKESDDSESLKAAVEEVHEAYVNVRGCMDSH